MRQIRQRFYSSMYTQEEIGHTSIQASGICVDMSINIDALIHIDTISDFSSAFIKLLHATTNDKKNIHFIISKKNTQLSIFPFANSSHWSESHIGINICEDSHSSMKFVL